jgi:hypothetical protein
MIKNIITEENKDSQKKNIADSGQSNLQNCNESKGKTFIQGNSGWSDDISDINNPLINILLHTKELKPKNKIIEIELNCCGFKNICGLNYEQTDLILGNLDYYVISDLEDYLNEDLPVSICLKYPFKKAVNIVIPTSDIDGKWIYITVGYLLWQITKACAMIYNNMGQEITWSTEFNQLGFRSLTIYKNNIISVDIFSYLQNFRNNL